MLGSPRFRLWLPRLGGCGPRVENTSWKWVPGTIHLAEILQGFAGNKLVGVGQAGSCSGNTPRLHLQEHVTGANMHSDFTVLHVILHIRSTYILRTIQNTKSDCGGIEHLGKTFFLGAVGDGPIVRHLAKKNKEG
jgi:hypothetical protein